MKFTTIIFSAALVAGVIAESTTGTTAATTATSSTSVSIAPVETNSSYGPVVDECLTECKQGDTGCLATCLGSPNPTEEQVNETTKCAAACKQGDGTEEQTKAYADCQWDCTVKYFLPNASNVPSMGSTKTTTGDTIVETDAEGNPTKTVSGDDEESTETSGTSTPSTTDEGSSAPAKVYAASFAGAAAAFAAFFAL